MCRIDLLDEFTMIYVPDRRLDRTYHELDSLDGSEMPAKHPFEFQCDHHQLGQLVP